MPDIFVRVKTALADRYTIERHLGDGDMAAVYLAEDLKHKRKVAYDPSLLPCSAGSGLSRRSRPPPTGSGSD